MSKKLAFFFYCGETFLRRYEHFGRKIKSRWEELGERFKQRNWHAALINYVNFCFSNSAFRQENINLNNVDDNNAVF